MADIHSTAIIDKNAEIAESAVIGPYCLIEDDVIIGEGCQISSHAVIKSGTRLGKNVKVAHGAVLGSPPQDLKFKNEKTYLEIGDDTTVREFATLNRGTEAHWKTEIGKNCFIMSYVHIAHDCIIGDNVVIANAVNMAGHVEVEDFVGIGGMTAIHQFVRIGQHCFVGGGLKINKDIPPFIRAMGDPVRFGGTNAVGLTRKGFTSEQLNNIKAAYRKIYYGGLNVSKAVEALAQEEGLTPEAKIIIEFIQKAERGIIRGGTDK